MITIRGKRLGVLIRDARLVSSKSLEDCAHAMGISVARLKEYEYGDSSPSLPELELLAYYLKIPLEHFWGKELLSDGGDGKEPDIDPQQITSLRQRYIGALLRKIRTDAGIELADLAEKSGISAEELDACELGDQPLPIPLLEVLVSGLGTSMREFEDRHGLVGSWSMQQRALRDFADLPLELQSFVCKPINRPYLELAQRLSEMSVEKLRSVAEGLLEITL
ncbi:MAG: transcriptional regulator [Anaerolineales bacterium]|nr:transcriptional regulator [Anaerolineales bacterium]